MGQSLELNCNCGYVKDVFIGEGLMAVSTDMIRIKFSPEELTGFETALENGAYDYSFGQIIAFCETCNDIVNVNRLRYVDGDQTVFVIGKCPQCKNSACPQEDSINCPICGAGLDVRETGLWD